MPGLRAARLDLGADGWVWKQVGYSIADIVAKAIYAMIIYQVARTKSFIDDPTFADVEQGHAGAAKVAPPQTAGKRR